MNRREMMMSGLAFAFNRGNTNEAIELVAAQAKSGFIGAAALDVRSGSTVIQKSFGKANDNNAVFLLASITKPMTVAAVMTQVDRKQIALADPVQRYIPEFRGQGRDQVLVRHLLTHTSGLPDMLPENEDLRKRHAPLSDFVAATCKTPLLFTPGTEVRYQSMGILLAAEILFRITKQPLPAYLDEHIYKPLQMTQTSLGLGDRTLAQTMQAQVSPSTDWDWNSRYWRNLAAPWGGAHSTAADVAKFLRHFAHPATESLKAMITDQTPNLKQHYGLGWSLDGTKFGKGCSPATFGHGGSTGNLCWFDPKKDLSFVLLTTKPAVESGKPVLRPVSDLVSTNA